MALIVESGEGMATANSYVSVQEADDYIALNFPEDDKWESLTTEQKEVQLIRATRFLDTMVRWASFIKDNHQSLAWPREQFKDYEGRIIPDNTVPTLIKDAQIELVYESLSNTLTTEAIKLQSEKFGDTTDSYASPVTVGGSELVRNIIKNLTFAGYARSRATVVTRHRV